MICVSVQHDLYLNVFSQSRHLFVPSVARFGIVAGLGNSFIVRNVVFLCSHFGCQFSEFVEGKVSKMLS